MQTISRASAILCLLFLYSCGTKEKTAEKVADEFLTQINDNTKQLDSILMTESFAAFFNGKGYYTSEEWVLTSKPDNDSVVLVESKGQTYNGLGRPIEITQVLALTNIYGGWKVHDSYNLTKDELDFEVVDTEWDFYWDRDKDEILKKLQESIKLKIIVRGQAGFFPTAREGKLRISNNSDYDIKDIKILIEHFDRKGKSVNTDYHRISDIIRKQGYREFKWYTNDCLSCYRQEFKINFVRENN